LEQIMSTGNKISRRSALGVMAGSAATIAAAANSETAAVVAQGKAKFKHSVCKWCYKMELEELCKNAKEMGIHSVELLGEKDWDVPKKYGLICAMPLGVTTIGDGWNNPARHDKHVQDAERLLPLAKQAGLVNFIVFSGNRDAGLSDKDGMANCAKGLKRIMPLAEQLGITVCMELLNSKVDHKGYMCDRTPWGVELCKQVGSERFKLLYDIYHMQIMEGDVVRTIQDYNKYISHYHTGGVPGRAEIDDTQELNYKRVCSAIADTGFEGHIAQEFIPRRDPMTSLREAVEICTV
jgi:hydroxypyruvate isomerase